VRFETPPSYLVDDFRLHVAETGQPETFPGITTTAPPKTGAVVPLWHPIRVPTERRPGRSAVPCPICSPNSPKWKSGGSLIWCEETLGIYAIGPDCYQHWWEDDRVDRALNALRQTQIEVTNGERLGAAATAAAAHLAWIEANLETAVRVGILQATLNSSAPKFRGAVARRLKAGMAGGIRGDGFLRGGWPMRAKLDYARGVYAQLRDRRDAEAWARQLAPQRVRQLLQDVRSARTAMTFVHDRWTWAAQFLERDNIARLAALGRARDAPIGFTAVHTGSNVEIRCGEEVWRGQIGIGFPPPLPAA
jgi:hypothetical protein